MKKIFFLLVSLLPLNAVENINPGALRPSPAELEKAVKKEIPPDAFGPYIMRETPDETAKIPEIYEWLKNDNMSENLVFSALPMEAILMELALSDGIPQYHIAEPEAPFWQKKASIYLKRGRDPHATIHLLSRIWGFKIHEDEDVFILEQAPILDKPETLITMRYERAPLELVIPAVLAPTGHDVLVSPQINGLITVKFSKVPVNEAFNAILEAAGLLGYKKHGIIFVLPSEKEWKTNNINAGKSEKKHFILSREESKKSSESTTNTPSPLPAFMENFTRILDKIGSKIVGQTEEESEEKSESTDQENRNKIQKAMVKKTAEKEKCVNAEFEYNILQKKSPENASEANKKDYSDLTDYESVLKRRIPQAVCNSEATNASFDIKIEEYQLSVYFETKIKEQQDYLLRQKVNLAIRDKIYTSFNNEVIFKNNQSYFNDLDPKGNYILKIQFELKK